MKATESAACGCASPLAGAPPSATAGILPVSPPPLGSAGPATCSAGAASTAAAAASCEVLFFVWGPLRLRAASRGLRGLRGGHWRSGGTGQGFGGTPVQGGG